MQVPSVTSQLQSKLIDAPKTQPGSSKPPTTNPANADSNQDGGISTSDKGQGLDTKA